MFAFPLVALLALLVPLLNATAAPANPSDASAAVAVQRVVPGTVGLRDEAAMLLIGTGLIGLAAFVRRRAV